MELPDWLKRAVSNEPHVTGSDRSSLLVTRYSLLRTNEQFLDKTLHHIISFIEDSIFNETTSMKNGLLQMVEPGLKIITLAIIIIVLSFQKSIGGILVFLFLSLFIAIASKISFFSFIKKLLPAFILTAFIAVPAAINLIVDGEPLFVLHRFGQTISVGPLVIPAEIAVTRQGLNSAITLCLRVVTSLSFVFLITMTTRPNRFIKSLSSMVPGALRSVVSVSYRYIYFLIRKVELFIMGFKSRTITATGSSKGRHWIASRVGLLFSISIEISRELGMAMESRGFKGEQFKVQSPKFKISEFSKIDVLWLIFTIIFSGIMFWKSTV